MFQVAASFWHGKNKIKNFIYCGKRHSLCYSL